MKSGAICGEWETELDMGDFVFLSYVDLFGIWVFYPMPSTSLMRMSTIGVGSKGATVGVSGI